MNILLSAYSVNPYNGSEDGVGWNWTLQTAKRFNAADDRIYILTKKFNEESTRRGLEENGLNNVELVITDTPDCLNWFREKHSAFHHMYYILWQRYAYRWAKKSKIPFDVVHHVTMGDFRITGCMWKLKEPYKIFGPAGGGQSTPQALKCYEKSKFTERVREIINISRGVSPLYKRSLNGFDAVYASNRETLKTMNKVYNGGCRQLVEIGLATEFENLSIDRKENDVVNILYLGRLIEKKGLMLLIDVVKRLPKNLNYTLSIYGSGPLKERIQSAVDEYGLGDKVMLCGAADHGEISPLYRKADIFVMPSLRETGGTVLIEAMAHSLPVVAPDMSLSHELMLNDCGCFYNVNQSREEIINDFACKLTDLISSPELRSEKGANGYNYVNSELTWTKKFETVYADFLK